LVAYVPVFVDVHRRDGELVSARPSDPREHTSPVIDLLLAASFASTSA
jgi:hypothetical protein